MEILTELLISSQNDLFPFSKLTHYRAQNENWAIKQSFPLQDIRLSGQQQHPPERSELLLQTPEPVKLQKITTFAVCMILAIKSPLQVQENYQLVDNAKLLSIHPSVRTSFRPSSRQAQPGHEKSHQTKFDMHRFGAVSWSFPPEGGKFSFTLPRANSPGRFQKVLVVVVIMPADKPGKNVSG